MPAIQWKKLDDKLVEAIKLPKQTDKPNQIVHIITEKRGRALVLIVSYGGTRTWRGLVYRRGKPKTNWLGTYPAMLVEDAKRAARQYWDHPDEIKAGSFREVAELWFKRHVETKALRSANEIGRILGRPKITLEKDSEPTKKRKKSNGYIFPRWGDRPFIEIRRGEVNELLDVVEDKHGKAQADACLAVIRGIMAWYQTRDENYTSPIVRGMKRNKGRKARDRVLNDNEICSVWEAAEEIYCFGAIVQLCLLTASRRDKLSKMKWSDIEGGKWTITREEREKGTAGQIQLPQLALDIIDKQEGIASNPYVFAGRGGASFNHWSEAMAELRLQLPKDMPRWTLHDLRRTARSLMARADVRPDVAERVLGHRISGVEGVYDRYQYAEQKADALTRLAELIQKILGRRENNVVPLSRLRHA